MEMRNERLERLNRRYRVLQRRTLLYGALATVVAMFIAVLLIQRMGATAAQGGILGGCVGVVAQQLSAILARKLTPYA